MLTVKQLKNDINKLTPSFDSIEVGHLQYLSNGNLLNKNTGEEFELSEDGFKNLVRYIGIPPYFADKLPTHILIPTIEHFISSISAKPVTLSHFGTEFHNLFDAKTLLLSPDQVVERVSRVFHNDDVISHLEFINGLVINVRTLQNDLEVKPGDFTQAGIRFNATYGAKPQVSAYMERLVCSNGMVVSNELDVIPLRGFTANEVLANIEHMAGHYLKSLLPNYLDNWKKMTTIHSSNPEQLIHRLSREHDLSPRLESSIIDAVSSLADNTYYNIVNLITEFQHADGIEPSQVYKLQQLGGSAVRDLGGHRCTSCQHSLS